jgi:hypothetical protein
MRFPLLEPPRVVRAAAFVALALGLGNAAWGDAIVTEKQAEAAALAAAAPQPAHEATVNNRAADAGDDVIDLQTFEVTETVIWAAPQEQMHWFPKLEEDAAPTAASNLLKLSPSPVQLTDTSLTGATGALTNEHAVIPLPPAAWTGLAGLASLATFGGRKAILRFFFS